MTAKMRMPGRGVQARRNRTLRSARARRVPRRPKNVLSGTTWATAGVPVLFTAPGLFGPETSVLLVRQLLEAFEQLLSELRPCLRVESESFPLDFFDAHDP